MSIKFNGNTNPSQVFWKSSSSATEQEVFAIQKDGSYVWAKPYTLISTPGIGSITVSPSSTNSCFRVSGKTGQLEYGKKYDTVFFQSGSAPAIGEEGTIVFPDGQTVRFSFTKPSYGSLSYYYDVNETEVVYSTDGTTASYCIINDDGYKEPILTLNGAAGIQMTVPSYARTDRTNYWFPNDYNSKEKYGVGVIVSVPGKFQANGLETGIWWPGRYEFQICLSLLDYQNLNSSDYWAELYTLQRVYFPITSDDSWNSAAWGFIPDPGYNDNYSFRLEYSSHTDNSVTLKNPNEWGKYGTFTFTFKEVGTSSGGTLKRTGNYEPTASATNQTIGKNSIVYYGDVLKLYDTNANKVKEWTVNQDLAENSNISLNNFNIVSLSGWAEVYWNNNFYVFGADYMAYNKITMKEMGYTSTNHKTKTTKTTNAETYYQSYDYTFNTGWTNYELAIQQEKYGVRYSQTLTGSQTVTPPSSITAPTITVTDLGSTYCNIRIKNNSSYAGSYYLSFKGYHSVGNPVTYTASGSIAANGTTTTTVNLYAYSSQGYAKGVAGTGQIYYLGKGSSAASFSKGDTGGNSGGGDVCLIKNTPILMADYTEKPIQDIVVGDEILGYDFENNCTTPAVVMYSIPTKFQQQAHYIIFDNGKTLCTTRGHELYVVEYGRYVPVEDIKEGEHCLDENGNETEVLAIHWDVELKTFEQFYHIVSSNNTYYANGILNAGVPIDKYRYIHDLRGENIPEPIEALIMDESKDTACFNFTVTNPEFVQKGTPYQSQIKKSRNRIWDLEKLIAKVDEAISKLASGLGLEDEYNKTKAKYYKEIAELQEKMANWEKEYNKLLAQYSELGDDILLDDQERRKKYFRRANKIANDNFEVYKANYVKDPAPKDLGEGVEFVRAEDDYLK